jgi:hypothetical protein
MPFGVNIAFKDYLDKFTKIFLDDFIVYNDMDTLICRNSKCVFITAKNSGLICTQISVHLWYFQG